ncbi:hypothetical protein A3A59_05205 [Candidatus Gottesmanbacteria bacterium RIFCSPLOWO2_01_FULL_42_10]|nr:MAG: hypothetical protein A3A59_05205 [Candidatus Gottesmanbacteria bacterium RIFCSPLOWO2_01_FULL_42_10]
MKMKPAVRYVIVAIALYLVSTGLSYGIFKSIKGNRPATVSPIPSGGKFVVDPSLPRTEVCPLNGQKFTEQERKIWETRRPLAVMIENHAEARPQSGLSYADIVYETVAEGGITRFMGVFYCGVAAYNIGLAPVRSARTYFLDWVSEYDALYNHVGGAGNCSDGTVDERAKALCQIDKYGIKDMDQFSIPFPICYRNYDRLDHPVATEHTMVCFSDKLYELAAKRKWTNVDEDDVAWDKNYQAWKFKDEAKEGERGTTASISFVHWAGYEAEYGVQWNYDSTTNSYKRLNGGQPHLDLETKEQLTAKSIAIQFAKETVGVDEHAHLLYGTIGSGKALVFQDGKVTVGTWKKSSRTARTLFFDETGKEIAFNRGQTWIEIVSLDTKVSY